MLNDDQLKQVVNYCDIMLNKINERRSLNDDELKWDNFQRRYFTRIKLSAECHLKGHGVIYYNSKEVIGLYEVTIKNSKLGELA